MKRLSPLLPFFLFSSALAGPNEPLHFELRPSQFHAYQSDRQKGLVLTLIVRNPLNKPVSLTCAGASRPVLRRFTEFQDGRPAKKDEFIGEFSPVDGAPVCSRAGEVLTIPANTVWRYSRNVGMQKAGAQVHYRAAWQVSLRPGFGWLQHAYATALVVPQPRPVGTPTPDLYQNALEASGAMWQTRTSRGVPANTRLSFDLADELSRQAFLAELKNRGLDASKVDIDVSPPVSFSKPPNMPHTAKVTVSRTAKGFEFVIKVTNTSAEPLSVQNRTCEPHAIERKSDGVVVYQQGNGPCPAMAAATTLLKPGGFVTRRVLWDGKSSIRQTVAPGQYHILIGLGQFVGQAEFTVP